MPAINMTPQLKRERIRISIILKEKVKKQSNEISVDNANNADMYVKSR